MLFSSRYVERSLILKIVLPAFKGTDPDSKIWALPRNTVTSRISVLSSFSLKFCAVATRIRIRSKRVKFSFIGIGFSYEMPGIGLFHNSAEDFYHKGGESSGQGTGNSNDLVRTILYP